MRRITQKHVSWLHRINNIAREYEIHGSEEKWIRLCHQLKTKAIKEGSNRARCWVSSDAVALSLAAVDISGQIIMCCGVCPVCCRTMSSNSSFYPQMLQHPLSFVTLPMSWWGETWPWLRTTVPDCPKSFFFFLINSPLKCFFYFKCYIDVCCYY